MQLRTPYMLGGLVLVRDPLVPESEVHFVHRSGKRQVFRLVEDSPPQWQERGEDRRSGQERRQGPRALLTDRRSGQERRSGIEVEEVGAVDYWEAYLARTWGEVSS